MVYRHTLVTRLTHAAFSLAFLALAFTGIQLLLHRHWIRVNAVHVHEYAGAVMLACGAIYLVNAWKSGELRKLLYGPDDASGIVPMVAYYLRLRKSPPVYSDYNPLQKLAYTGVLFGLGPLLAVTGILMWARVGGRGLTVWHLAFAIELSGFVFGHLVMVATTGLRNNVRSMITGWYRSRAIMQFNEIEDGSKLEVTA